MAAITKEQYMAQFEAPSIGKNHPIIDTDSIAVAGTIIERTGRGEISEWTPLSSYLHDIQYNLPTASSSVLGGIKIGTGLSISNGVVSVNTTIPTLSVNATGTGFIKDFSVNGHSITITKEDINTYFNVSTTTSTAFNPCGGSDTISGNNRKVTVVTGISANGSTVTANTQQIDFGTLNNTLSSILTRLTALEQRVSALEQNGTAPKQVTVTFNADGGNCTVSSLQVNVGSTIAVMPTVTKSGYTFLGWYNGSTQYTTTTPINAAVTLTAKWQAEPKYATITTYPTGKSLRYNGESQEIINEGVGTNGIFYYNTTASDSGKVSTVSDSALKRTDAGEYTAYYKFVANAGYFYTNSVWTPVTTTISRVNATITNPGTKTITFGTDSTVTLSYTGLSKVSVTSSNTSNIAASVSGNKLTLSAKTGTGSAIIAVSGTAVKNYTTPTAVTFTANAAKATNAITITPADTTVSVNNGLHNGNPYYTISSISTTSKTSSTITSSDTTMLYFISPSGENVKSESVSGTGNSSVTAYFNPSVSDSSAKLTISNTGGNNYNNASKTITFNFTKTSTGYKYYLGVQTENVITSTTSVNKLISGSTQTATSKHTEITWPTATTNDYYQLYIYPTSWGTIKGLTNKSDNKPIGFMTAVDLDITAPSGYAVIAISDAKTFGGTTSVITW